MIPRPASIPPRLLLRLLQRSDEGGDVPLSDAGPLPGQAWPQSYDPAGADRFLDVVKGAGSGIKDVGSAVWDEIKPPMPKWPSSRDEALAQIIIALLLHAPLEQVTAVR